MNMRYSSNIVDLLGIVHNRLSVERISQAMKNDGFFRFRVFRFSKNVNL